MDFLDAVEDRRRGPDEQLRQHAKRFFLNYIKAVAGSLPRGRDGYSIKTGAAPRAFIRVAPT